MKRKSPPKTDPVAEAFQGLRGELASQRAEITSLARAVDRMHDGRLKSDAAVADFRSRFEAVQQDFARMTAGFVGHETMHADMKTRLGQLAYLSEHSVLRAELNRQFAKPLGRSDINPEAERARLLADEANGTR